MTNLELILVILLSISALLNVGLIIYVRKAIVESFAEQLETFEYIYDLIEKEVDEDENLTNDTTETEESKT
mgnify:CR=1 FL=1